MEQSLRERLPAGEYTAVEFLRPGGMMAKYSVHGIARAVRQQRDCYFKAIFPAPEGAGKQTEVLTNPDRLRRLAERFRRLSALGDRTPAVPVIDVRLLEPDGVLFTAMEQVRVLEDVIGQGASTELAGRVLRTLAPSDDPRLPWLHYDVCPGNAGLLPDGSVVLIDLETMYLDVQDMSPLTVLAHKGWRDPAGAEARIQNASSPTEKQQGALQKLQFNVLLLAAECRFGLAEIDGFHADDWAMDWLSRKNAGAVWLNACETLLNGGRLDLNALALAVEAENSTPLRPMCPPPGARKITEEPEEGMVNDSTTVFVEPWDALRRQRVALRRDALDLTEIENYTKALEKLAQTTPTDARVWKELRLIALAFSRDPATARKVMDRALVACPDEPSFRLWRRILRG